MSTLQIDHMTLTIIRKQKYQKKKFQPGHIVSICDAIMISVSPKNSVLVTFYMCCVFPLNFCTKKLDETAVFYAA